MLPPVVVSWFYNDGAWLAFAEAFAIILVTGLAVFLPLRRHRAELRIRDGFLVVAGFWVLLGIAGGIPLILVDIPIMSFTEAVFESVSGFTTTGATVLVGLDTLPRSVLWYRQQTQWFGGMGIIVLAVAILPVLGVGGMQLYRAETPGPIKDTKLTPRITETAKALWYLYLGFTIICAASYWAAGMSVFDALCHSFSTVAIGGFSTHDLSIGHFQSTTINLIAVVFMFLAGINFSLHFFAWRYSSIAHYFKDPEFRAYSFILMMLVATIVMVLALRGTYESPLQAAEHGLFQAVSIATTTGFTTANYSAWPGALPVLLIFASFIGR